MRSVRTFTSPYEDKRVRRPDFSLSEAVDWFLDDARSEIEETTWRSYRSYLGAFIRWLPDAARTLASVEPETVERFVRSTSQNANTKRNKLIALKSLGTYLARKRIWYAGSGEVRQSVLAEVKAPTAPAKGTPRYSAREVKTMVLTVAHGPSALPGLRNTWSRARDQERGFRRPLLVQEGDPRQSGSRSRHHLRRP